MGYTTDFSGEFNLDHPLTAEHAEYLKKFNRTRRMKRDATKAALYADPVRIAAGLPIGEEGAYFVGAHETDFGQDHTSDIIDHNAPPDGQPGLWCQWVPSDDFTTITWDEGEKFYYYVEWLEYLIKNFLKPWGYVLSGEVSWQGEDNDDRGTIFVKNNQVQTLQAVIQQPEPNW